MAEKASIAAESRIRGPVAAIARKHGATRWQVCDWRRRLRQGHWHAGKHGVGAMMMEEESGIETGAWSGHKDSGHSSVQELAASV